MMIPIVYRDRWVLVCVKPAGVLSQAGPGEDLLALLQEQEGVAALPVHRLDRGVGGLMAVAAQPKAAAKLSAAITDGSFCKEYLCVVHGAPAQEAGTYRDLLFHDRGRNKTFVVDRMRAGVKEAVLDYRVLYRAGERTLVRVWLRTGRTHQIRAQFAARRTPLVGDGKYGGGSGAIALWSWRLGFPHPATGEAMDFSRLPEGDVWSAFPLARLLGNS